MDKIKLATKNRLTLACSGDANGFSLALSAGADLAAVDDNGWTPAMLAAHFGHGPCLSLLVAAGAWLNARTHHGQPPPCLPLGLGTSPSALSSHLFCSLDTKKSRSNSHPLSQAFNTSAQPRAFEPMALAASRA